MSAWDDTENEDLVRKASVTYLLNDLRYALTNTKTDVDFKVFRSVQKSTNSSLNKSAKIAKSTNDDDDDSHDVSVIVPLHSSVLLARLPWFRENYESLRDKDYNADDAEKGSDTVIEKAGFDSDSKKYIIELIKADKENNTGVDPNTVYEFVKFVYSAQCRITSETVNGLLRLAHKFEFESLIEKIEEYYINKLTKTNDYDLKKQIELLKISDHYQLEAVKTETMKQIKENPNATTSPAWKKLLNDDPKLLSETYKD